jgi:hypothetical protein
MAATPAGKDNTPAPTHPLIRLNAAVAIVCLGSSTTCALLLDEEDLTRDDDDPPPRIDGTASRFATLAMSEVVDGRVKDVAVVPTVVKMMAVVMVDGRMVG